jgi:hypothetical protein
VLKVNEEVQGTYIGCTAISELQVWYHVVGQHARERCEQGDQIGWAFTFGQVLLNITLVAHILGYFFTCMIIFLKRLLHGVGSEPGSFQFHLFSHFHHFTNEPQRLTYMH